ncbi:MAG: hypothetical protein KDA72_10960 [Planctomycetales bacterium]|nr:hypothetical protein [Planctomycetales bacterium]
MAHHSAFVSPTFADADATVDGFGARSTIIGELKVSLRRYIRMVVFRPMTQVLVGRVRIDHFAGIHLSLRIKNGFEFAKRVHQLLTIHFG